ncbi:MAG TPA: 5-guanidino-2-oxopentanoate decarboxylase [Steroidobacteraceae bacterium]|jgi:5-guanidino-2-oxopentanoate decarboxylase|nr:5-guanidino-2-oxopentanoate decarboxylase [Steroidobacteraceae bacterium]
MNTTALRIGSYIAQLLAANGIDTVFGIPGVHTLELYRDFASCGLRHVLVRHEQAAGFAADGYARISGRPAAAFVISGPGVTNILTAAAQAYSDSVPMLIIASAPVRASHGQKWGVLHELSDQRALVATVLDTARAADSADDVRDHLRAAFASLHSGRARPAYVQIPLDLLAQTTTLRPERFDGSAPAHPQPSQLEAACALLANARRPLVIAGGGARAAGAQLLHLIEALDGYCVSTAAGKGILRECHPANLGASLPYPETQALIAQADVVLAVGTEISETDVYTTTKLPLVGQMIRIDIDPQKLADHYAAAVRLRGDSATTLAAIGQHVKPRSGWRTGAGAAQAHRARLEERFDARTRARMRALQALRAALPADAAVFSDMTQIAYLGNYAFAADRPGVWFHPAGYGTLGYALPAALGAKIAAPERASVALAGDFGLQFTLHELMTAVELGLTLPIVVWNNAALGQIRDDMIAADIAPIAVVARNPDFPALAAACGAHGIQVASPAALTEAVRSALQRPGPTLIEALASEF